MEEDAMADGRAAIAKQFELQIPQYAFIIVEKLSNYRYRLEAEGSTFLAIVLETSWQAYERRMIPMKYGINIAIVGHHDCLMPISVLDISDGYSSGPGQLPRIGPHGRRRTEDQRRLLLSQIILGSARAEEELARLSARSRGRYQQEARQLLYPKRGRPYAS
jgi:hypothetical protein